MPNPANTILYGVCVCILGDVREYCQFDTMEAACPEGQVIVMEHAFYGRMRTGGCIKQNYDTSRCQANVIPFVDSICSGRRECTLRVPDISSEGDIRPCSEDLASYLEASYACLPGEIRYTTNGSNV